MAEFGSSVLINPDVQKSPSLEERLQTVLYGGGIPDNAIELGMMRDLVAKTQFADPEQQQYAVELTSKEHWLLSTDEYFARARTAAAAEVKDVAPEHVDMLGSYKYYPESTVAQLAVRTLANVSSKLLFLHEDIANEQRLEAAYLQSGRSLRPASIPGRRMPWRPYSIATPAPKQRTPQEAGTVELPVYAQRGPEIVRHRKVSKLAQRMGALFGRAPQRHY